MRISKVVLVVLVVGILAGAYALGYLDFLSSKTASVGFQFDNAPSNMGGGQIWIDGVSQPVMNSQQGGFISLKTGSQHDYKLDINGRSFTGVFVVPHDVSKGDVVIIHIDWNTAISSVVVVRAA